MTIANLTVSHLSGDAIYASKHSTQTAAVNEIVGAVNGQTDFSFDGFGSVGTIYEDKNGYLIAGDTWSGDSSNKILIPNLYGKYLTEIVLEMDRSDTSYWGVSQTLELYAGPTRNYNKIIDDTIIPANRVIIWKDDDTIGAEKRYMPIRVGVLKLPDTKMLLRIENTTAGTLLKIDGIYFIGFEKE